MPQRVTPKAFDDITKDEFQAYENVRRAGGVNMLDPLVQEFAGFDRETHLGIIAHYRELAAQWPDVRDLPAREARQW